MLHTFAVGNKKQQFHAGDTREYVNVCLQMGGVLLDAVISNSAESNPARTYPSCFLPRDAHLCHGAEWES